MRREEKKSNADLLHHWVSLYTYQTSIGKQELRNYPFWMINEVTHWQNMDFSWRTAGGYGNVTYTGSEADLACNNRLWEKLRPNYFKQASAL